MTNREHMIRQLENMSVKEFCDFMESSNTPWCTKERCSGYTCAECKCDWAEATYKEPMPELRVGMFVKVRHNNSTEDYIGVITLDENDNKVIVYKENTWDFVARVKDNIIAVYKTNCFIDCDDESCIWKKS